MKLLSHNCLKGPAFVIVFFLDTSLAFWSWRDKSSVENCIQQMDEFARTNCAIAFWPRVFCVCMLLPRLQYNMRAQVIWNRQRETLKRSGKHGEVTYCTYRFCSPFMIVRERYSLSAQSAKVYGETRLIIIISRYIMRNDNIVNLC